MKEEITVMEPLKLTEGIKLYLFHIITDNNFLIYINIRIKSKKTRFRIFEENFGRKSC